MGVLDVLYLSFLFLLGAFLTYEVLRGCLGFLPASLRRRTYEPLHGNQCEQQFGRPAPPQLSGARRSTNAFVTLGTAAYIVVMANALTTPGWLPVLLMGNLIFGLLITILLGVTAGTLHHQLRTRDRIWFRVVHGLLWPLHLLHGRNRRA
jgi:hypothetical protein